MKRCIPARSLPVVGFSTRVTDCWSLVNFALIASSSFDHCWGILTPPSLHREPGVGARFHYPVFLDSESGCWILDAGFSMLDFRCWILDVGLWMLDFGCLILDPGFWILDSGCWILDAEFWIEFWEVVNSGISEFGN